MFDHNAKLLTRIFWQYRDAPNMIRWLLILPDIAQSQLEDQLTKIQSMLDIDTAEGEQLDICGRIAGIRQRPVARFSPDCDATALNDELFRKVIKSKVFKNNGVATLDDVKEAADYILDVDTIVLDGEDMSMRLVWEGGTVSPGVQQLVTDLDLIPRPQGVGMRNHRVVKYKPFGFGRGNANFNRAPFWYGDGIPATDYYGSLVIHYDAGGITGQLSANELDVADQDVTLILTAPDKGITYRYAVTDKHGAFTVSAVLGPVTVVAKSQLISPICEVIEIESEPLVVGN